MSQTVFSVIDVTPLVWGCVITGLVLLYHVLTSIAAYWRLRHFKGPTLAAWSEIWSIRAAVSQKGHLEYADVCERYGRIARIGPNTLLTCDEDLYRRANTVRSAYTRGDFYKAFRFDAELENVFSETDSAKHTAIRKVFFPGFLGRENPWLEPDIDTVLWQLISSWKSRYLSSGSITKPMDLATQMQYYTLDIITSVALGTPFGYVTTDSDVYEYIGTMAANFPLMAFMSTVPALSRLMRQPWFIRVFGPSTRDRVGMGKTKAVTSEIIARRFADVDKERGDDMTQNFIRHGATKLQIEDNIMLQILAGSDTSATILRSGLLHMITNPRVWRQLQAEADAAGVPYSEIISEARALELPYLQACVKEAFRYHPAATGLFHRVVPPQGDYCDGKYIPGGTQVGFAMWSMHRLNTDAYGPDAHIFRPERWLEADAERRARMDKAHELVFGYGEWKCLGYRIALMEVRKAFFELVRRYDFSVINPKKPIESDINYGVFLQNGMWVRMEDRHASS